MDHAILVQIVFLEASFVLFLILILYMLSSLLKYDLQKEYKYYITANRKRKLENLNHS